MLKIAIKTLIFIEAIIKRRWSRCVPAININKQLYVNLVTSGSKKCGIATYSTYLATELRKHGKIYITKLTNNRTLSPYYMTLGYKVGRCHDLVHVQFEYGIFPSLKIGKKTLTAFSALLFYFGLALGNRRVVTTIHEPRKAVTAGGQRGIFYTWFLDKLVFSVSDLIVVHTKESKLLMKTLYRVNSERIRVIPHGSYEHPLLLNKEEAKAKFGLKGKTVVTILGFVTPKKGHDLVIPLLLQFEKAVHLVIAGGPQNAQDERYLERLMELAKQNRCADRITFTGYLPDFTSILNATDIAILPYRTVTDSGVLHLLLAHRVPTLASDLAAFQEVYDEYGCLELFKSGDSQDLLLKLRLLLSDMHRQEVLKTKCLDMWNATKWSNIAEMHIEMYRELLSTPCS